MKLMNRMTDPSISVIVPLYNKEAYIAKTLDSVLNQTYQNYEILIINDGSTDKSTDIINTYTDTRIHLVNQENKGVAAARNLGIEIAKSELIAFLDADDEWLPEYLETIIKLRKDYPNAGIYATAYYINNTQTQIKQVILCSDVPKDFEGLLPSYYHAIATGPHPIETSGIVIPHKILNEVGVFNETLRISEDLDLWARIGYHYPIAYSSKPCSVYNMGTANNHKVQIRKKADIISIPNPQGLKNQNMPIYETDENLSLYISYLHILQAQAYINTGDLQNAKKSLSLSKHHAVFLKKLGCWLYIYIPKKYFLILLKFTGKFTKIGQTL